MSIKKEKEYCTIDDIYALPEGERAELINGRIYGIERPSTTHQILLFNLSLTIGKFIKTNYSDCRVALAPFAIFLDQDTYVEPDLSVIRDTSKLDENGCHGAPDWIIEIVSPSSKRMDYGIKQFKYRSAGVREYWVVDISQKNVTVFDFENDNLCEYDFNRKIPVAIFNGELQIDFSKFN
nr:unnamed protein product [uncultured bacterium]